MDFFIDLSVSRFDNTNAVASHLRAFGMAVSLSPSDEKLCVSLYTALDVRENETRTSLFLDSNKDYRNYMWVDWTVGEQPKNTSTAVVLPGAYHTIKDANERGIVDTFLEDVRQNAAMKVRNRTRSLQEATPPWQRSLYRLGSAPFAFLDYSAVSY